LIFVSSSRKANAVNSAIRNQVEFACYGIVAKFFTSKKKQGALAPYGRICLFLQGKSRNSPGEQIAIIFQENQEKACNQPLQVTTISTNRCFELSLLRCSLRQVAISLGGHVFLAYHENL
jgi:hypothetical protein